MSFPANPAPRVSARLRCGPGLLALLAVASLGAGSVLGQADANFGAMPGAWSMERRGQSGVANVRVFFPPVPPRLGSPLAPPDRTAAGGQGQLRRNTRRAPAELAPYANEIFYMPLATRLSENTLAPRHLARLTAYLTTKLALQNALQDKLDAVRNADAAVRERELAALAAVQGPALVALEKDAEALRNDLVSGILILQEDVNWYAMRNWRLGSSSFQSEADAISAQVHVLLGAAYYQDGILPAHRRLLREAAIELTEVANAPAGTESVESELTLRTDNSPLLFFSPDLARVRLPASLPASLLDRIAAYEQERSLLKRELVAVVTGHDAAVFGMTHTRAFVQMVANQRPRLEAMEKAADVIRRELVAYPLPRPSAPPPLPPALSARIERMLKDQKAAQEKHQEMIAQVERLVTIERMSTSRRPDGKQILSVSMRPPRGQPQNLLEARKILEAYSQETDVRNGRILDETASVRNDLGLLVGNVPDAERTRLVDELLGAFTTSMEELDLWVKYQDYRSAVMEPGLSPEQRRLLFDGAIVGLNLPLPESERAPRETRITPVR